MKVQENVASAGQSSENLAALNICKCPYDHLVLSKSDVHPQVASHLEMIGQLRLFGRNKALKDTVAVADFSAGGAILPATLLLTGTVRVQEMKLALKPTLASYPEEERKQINEALNLACIPGFEYMPANVATKLMTNLVRRISLQGEQPFVKDRGDFDAGVVDNKMNLVLIKKPENIDRSELKAMAGFIKTMQWKQPFQRTRFDIPN